MNTENGTKKTEENVPVEPKPKRKYTKKAVKMENSMPEAAKIDIPTKPKIEVTAVISTRNRYESTLPLTLQAILNQTYLPKFLLIYDDGDLRGVDLRQNPVYRHIFDLFSFKGIAWFKEPGYGVGQVANHIKSLARVETDWIWRSDDDVIPEANVLEKLVSHIDDKVGAVGGVIINEFRPLPPMASNKIEDIFLGMNEQWYPQPKDAKVHEVDHLYSSFIYRRAIAEYPENLSKIGFREETILTYEMKRKGYKNIFDPSAVSWHYSSPTGGVRVHTDNSMVLKDGQVFTERMLDWGVKTNKYEHVVLNEGLGDHFAFKSILRLYMEKNKGKKNIFFLTFPEVFEDVFKDEPNVIVASIADALMMYNGDISKFSLYKFMIDNRWEKGIPWAFKNMYKLSGEPMRGAFGSKDVQKGTGDTVIISPYSVTPRHAKSYPFWRELVPMIKKLGFKVVQIGKKDEDQIPVMDDYWFGLSLAELQKRISECRCWVSVDNFLQHMVNSMPTIVPGVVIYGISNPKLFGYAYNKNVLKDEKYLRPDPYGEWKGIVQNPEAFETPEKVIEQIKEVI